MTFHSVEGEIISANIPQIGMAWYTHLVLQLVFLAAMELFDSQE